MKAKLTTLSLAGWLSLASQLAAAYPDLVLADNPLGYWRLADSGTSGDSPPVVNLGSAGAAANGSYINFVFLGQPGALAAGNDTAVSFPAQGYVGVPWIEALNPAGAFTVEAWVKPNSTVVDYYSLLSSINFSDTSRAGWQFYQTPTNQWEFRVGSEESATYLATATGGTVTPGQWTHIAGVYDGTNTITLYVNGQAAASATLTGPYSPNTSTPLGMAARILPTGVDRYLACTLDEVAIYSSALSAETIAAHYSRASDPAPSQPYEELILASSPVGYWRLGEANVYATAANAGSLGAAGTGYYVNDPTPGAEGVVAGDSAVLFDGIDDKIEVPYNPALNPNGPFTIEIWAKAFSGSAYRAPMASRDDTPVGNSAGYILYLNPSNAWQFWVGTGGSWASVTGPQLNEDEWTHLVGQYDGHNIYFIVDGVQVGSLRVPNFRVNSARPFRIGASANEGPGNFFWDGTLDEAAFYGTLLPHDRILAHYQELKGQPESLAPEILTQPAGPNDAVYAGTPVQLTASVSGTLPLSYQWYKDGTPIAGQTSPVLNLENPQEIDTGSYSLLVSNSFGAIESNPVYIDIIPNQTPVIEAHPQSIAAFPGAPASFSVLASGSLTFTYQWQKDNVDIPGATSATLLIPQVTAESVGTYRVIVSNAAGSTTSDGAQLSLLPIPADPYGKEVASDGPIAWWRLDEASSDDGVIADVMLANPGYADVSPPTFGVEGIPGTNGGLAAYFESGLQQKIDIPYSPNLNRTAFSVECWARVTGGSSYRSPVTSRDDGPQRGYIFYVNPDSNWAFWTGTGSSWNSINGPAVEPEEWAHLVAVVDGQSKSFYVNGVFVGSNTSALSLNMARPLRIGGGATEGNGAYFFEGDIDEVAVYGHALSAERVAAHYAAGITPGGGTGTEPTLTITPAGNNSVTITWSSGTLETSTDLKQWTSQPAASSPLTETLSGAKFYRVRY